MFGIGNPKQMQALFKQLGIKTRKIEAKRVKIEREDGTIVIENPDVTEIEMKGVKTYQITGSIKEEETGPREEDIKFVMEQTNCSYDEARKALQEAEGNIAEAILKLKG